MQKTLYIVEAGVKTDSFDILEEAVEYANEIQAPEVKVISGDVDDFGIFTQDSPVEIIPVKDPEPAIEPEPVFTKEESGEQAEKKKVFKQVVQNIAADRIKDELKAMQDYKNDADGIEAQGKELDCDCGKKIAANFRDLAKEENRHIGELENIVNKVSDGEFEKEVQAGKEESKEELGEKINPSDKQSDEDLNENIYEDPFDVDFPEDISKEEADAQLTMDVMMAGPEDIFNELAKEYGVEIVDPNLPAAKADIPVVVESGESGDIVAAVVAAITESGESGESGILNESKEPTSKLINLTKEDKKDLKNSEKALKDLKQLNEDLDERQKLFNDALKLAKKINKPVIYGYTDKTGKFNKVDAKEFVETSARTAYPDSTYAVAYPDKSEIKECKDLKESSWVEAEEKLKDGRIISYGWEKGEGYYVDVYYKASDKDGLVRRESRKTYASMEDAKKAYDNLKKKLNEGFHDGEYDPKDGWTEEDIKLHKSIDWRLRHWDDFDAGDEFKGKIKLYGGLKKPEGDKPGMPSINVEERDATFHKFIRSNPVFPPYYRAIEEVDGYVGPMYDGRKHKTYNIHDRYETQEVNNLLSEDYEDPMSDKELAEKLEQAYKDKADKDCLNRRARFADSKNVKGAMGNFQFGGLGEDLKEAPESGLADKWFIIFSNEIGEIAYVRAKTEEEAEELAFKEIEDLGMIEQMIGEGTVEINEIEEAEVPEEVKKAKRQVYEIGVVYND